MPFTALYKDNIINALTMNDDDWQQLKESEKGDRVLQCPECEESMVARAGIQSVISPHFAHNSKLIEGEIKACSLRKGKEHLYIQEWIFNVCQKLRLDVHLEHKIEIGNRYRMADICLPKRNKIIEVQLSTQSDDDYCDRQNDYENQGYEAFWVTWKKNLWNTPHLEDVPYAKISIRSQGKTLRNKANITKASQFFLLARAMHFQEYRGGDFEVCTVDKTVNMLNMISTFAFDKARYVPYCDICDSPHWCGEQCLKVKPKIDRLIKNKKKKDRLKRERLRRKQRWLDNQIIPDADSTPNNHNTEPAKSNYEISNPTVDNYSKDDFRKHFTGELYRYDIELYLKYTDRPVYESARIARENRMLGLNRDIPLKCSNYLEALT